MSAATASPSRLTIARTPRTSVVWIILLILPICAIVAGIVFALSPWWPYSQSQVLEDLREATGSQVQVGNFHTVYFPSPGCVLDQVSFHHLPNEAKPLITIERVTVQGDYLELIAQRVHRITAEGVVIAIPAFGTGDVLHTTPSRITIDEFITNNAVLSFATHDPSQFVRFDIRRAVVRDIGWSNALKYEVSVRNPEPPGEVTAEGKFGPWNRPNAAQTPISGKYKFENADLSFYKAIAGQLSSTGNFSGILGHIEISGTTDVPDFEVTMGHHPVQVTTKFSAYVDATDGDTFLKRVEADLRRTHIVAKGSIAKSSNGNSKTALLDLESSSARIDDLLGLFVQANRSPMSGTAAIHAHIEIPPGSDFLKKIKLQGSFGVGRGSFSDASTQKDVDSLSAGARGKNGKEKEDPETVLAHLEGKVGVANGSAQFSDLFFQIPGAHVRLHGTYNLVNYKIDLRGRMKVDSKISDTESGPKAFLLKVMDPIFKKKKKGEVVPVRISGTYEHPTFGLDVNDKKHTSKSSFTLH
jgi:hypothetical protein